ncbi:MAG: hypothetical protein ABL994_15235, partial [Verrucomicrobiales bacterium]
ICIGHHKIAGDLEFEMYELAEVFEAGKRIKADEKKGAFSILLKSSERVEVDKIPRVQLERLEELAAKLGKREQDEEGA